MWVLLFSVLKLEQQTLLKSTLATALRSSMECKTVRFFTIKCNCASHKSYILCLADSAQQL